MAEEAAHGHTASVEPGLTTDSRCPLPTVQPHHHRQGLCRFKAIWGCRCGCCSWLSDVPEAQVGGAHPIASSNLNVRTARVAGTPGCQHRADGAGGVPSSFPASPIGHSGLKCCPFAPYSPYISPVPLSACLCPSIPVSLTHTSVRTHAGIRKCPLLGETWNSPRPNYSPCRNFPDRKAVILQAPGEQSPPSSWETGK